MQTASVLVTLAAFIFLLSDAEMLEDVVEGVLALIR